MHLLVTGAAGFIGFHTCKTLLEKGVHVVGLDSLNDYYDVNLKKERLKLLEEHSNFSFELTDISELVPLRNVFTKHQFDAVIHLAAQAGVRYSLINPFAYEQSNGIGFLNMLECAKEAQVKRMLYASSSSVYGGNKKSPFSETDPVEHPISLYAATKRSNELVAEAYRHLFGMQLSGFRFFTVYGPWGRPDMALFLFTKAILNDEPIKVFNYGKMQRDFTYIDDIVNGLCGALEAENIADIYNLGNHRPIELLYFIECIEKALGKPAKKELLPIQEGDVPATCADIDRASKDLNYSPSTSIEEGIQRFIVWYRSYYR